MTAPAPERVLGAVVLEVARRELEKRALAVQRIEERLERVRESGDASQITRGAIVLVRARRELLAWTKACEEAARTYALQVDATSLEEAW